MDEQFEERLEYLATLVEESQQRRVLRMGLYGEPDMGKTTLALHCTQGNGLLVYNDSAYQVIHKYPQIKERVKTVPFQGLRQLRDIAIAWQQGIEPWCSLQDLIWDPASASMDTVLRNLVEGKKGTIDWRKHQPDPEVEGWPHYRIASRKLLDTIIELNKTNLNIIYVGHTKEPNKDNEAKKVKPNYAIRMNLPQACLEVIHKEVLLLGWCHKEIQGQERRVQFEGTAAVTAKSQMSTINSATYDQNQIPELIEKWRNQ